MTTPSLPPVYRPIVLGGREDPFAHAQKAAAAGAADGTLVWSRRPDRFDCAVILAPDAPLGSSLRVSYVALLGLGDALGTLAPPVTAVTFGWPDRLEVNGATAGGVRLAAAEADDSGDAVPAWMVVGATVAISNESEDEEPGRDLARTTLRDEGCGEIEAAALLESFGRHFLAWVNRWQEDGFGPVREAWLNRAAARGQPVEFDLAGESLSGTFAGLDEAGGLLLVEAARTRTVPLTPALSAASWSL
ncbi:biotin/lipoate--protein ligase family protein [Rhodospirillaceae bacterium SYSU D60014]|uniref:biotin/lipoate--protein ligase family protein n=1 Tax=Virgifigura deserti TaxID=2268457 RepID=UPI000E661FEB